MSPVFDLAAARARRESADPDPEPPAIAQAVTNPPRRIELAAA